MTKTDVLKQNQYIVNRLLYSLDQRPPLGRTLLYAAQWLLIVLPLITITSNLMAAFLGMDQAASTALFQRFCLVVGLVTALQCLFGHRYPLLDGPSAALLLSVAVLGSEGLEVVAGGMLAGGLVLALLGGLGVVHRIQPLFTDLVVGTVLLLISTTLLPFLYPMVIGVGPARPHGDPLILALSTLIMLAIVLISHWARGFMRNLSIFLGILLGYVLMLLMGRVQPPPVGNLSWVVLPDPFFTPGVRFTLPAALSFLLAYLAVLINGLGSYFSVSEVVGREGLQRRIERGIALTGGGGILSALFGVVGTVSYSLSPGVILVTGVGSRWPVFLCGLLLVLLAFFQKVGAVISSVPSAVVGAALFVTLAAQMGVGISVIMRQRRDMDVRDYIVVGLPLLLGTAASMLPPETLALFPPPTRVLVGNGLIVGIVAVLLLEHVILRISDLTLRPGSGLESRIPEKNSGE
ncbi:MAG: purine/pyrimidine permease [bacterium]|nr:MAG: purine/pyrimidine permease [bacterium]